MNKNLVELKKILLKTKPKYSALIEYLMIHDTSFKKSSIILSAGISRVYNHILSKIPFAFITAFKPQLNINNIYEEISKLNLDINDWGIEWEFKNRWNRKDTRNTNSNNSNIQKNKELAIDIRNNGLSWIMVDGVWSEKKDIININNGINIGNITETSEEKSFFIIGKNRKDNENKNDYNIFEYENFKNIVISLQLKYTQMGILIGICNDDNIYNIELTDDNGNIKETYNNISIKTAKEFQEMVEKLGSLGSSKIKNRNFVFSGEYAYQLNKWSNPTSMIKDYEEATGLKYI